MKRGPSPRGTRFIDHLREELRNPEGRLWFGVADVEFEVGMTILEAREKAGMTQRQLADAIDSNQQVISRIEVANHNVTIQTLEKIAHALKRHVVIQFVDEREFFKRYDGTSEVREGGQSQKRLQRLTGRRRRGRKGRAGAV